MLRRMLTSCIGWFIGLSLLACSPQQPAVQQPAFAPQTPAPQSDQPTAPSSALAEDTPATVPAESPQANNPPTEADIMARVNGEPILRAEYEKRVQQFQEADLARGVNLSGEAGQMRLSQIEAQVFEGLVDQLIIEQSAARMGIQVDQQNLEAQINQMKQGQSEAEFQDWLAQNNFTYADFEANLRAQLVASALFENIAAQAPQSAEQVSVRHILLKDLGQAQNVLARLQNGEDFVTLAQSISEDMETRSLGGDLGWLPRGTQQIPPQVENAAFNLAVGDISPVIESVVGYHIIKVDGREADRPLTPEHRQILQGQLFNNWLLQQRASATIERTAN